MAGLRDFRFYPLRGAAYNPDRADIPRYPRLLPAILILEKKPVQPKNVQIVDRKHGIGVQKGQFGHFFTLINPFQAAILSFLRIKRRPKKRPRVAGVKMEGAPSGEALFSPPAGPEIHFSGVFSFCSCLK
jgi:hypothetical protein